MPDNNKKEIDKFADLLKKDCSISNVMEAVCSLPEKDLPKLFEMLKGQDFSKIIFDNKADPDKRHGAVYLYMQTEPPEKMEVIVPLALGEPEGGVRLAALLAVKDAGLADERFVSIAESKIADISLRQVVIEVLGTSKKVERRVLFNLFKKYLEDEHRELRGAAALSLGKLGDEKAVPILKKRLAKETDKAVIKMIQDSLLNIALKSKLKEEKVPLRMR